MRNVIPSQLDTRPFTVATRFGAMTVQRIGSFTYAVTEARDPEVIVGRILILPAGEDALYLARVEGEPGICWRRNTIDAGAEMIALHLAESR